MHAPVRDDKRMVLPPVAEGNPGRGEVLPLIHDTICINKQVNNEQDKGMAAPTG